MPYRASLHSSPNVLGMRIMVSPEEYELTGKEEWQDFPDPGYHWPLGGTVEE